MQRIQQQLRSVHDEIQDATLRGPGMDDDAEVLALLGLLAERGPWGWTSKGLALAIDQRIEQEEKENADDKQDAE